MPAAAQRDRRATALHGKGFYLRPLAIPPWLRRLHRARLATVLLAAAPAAAVSQVAAEPAQGGPSEAVLPAASAASATHVATEPQAQPTSSPPAGSAPAAAPRRSWDAAIGFLASYAPEYAGSSRWALGVQPGGWVRWGRLSIASRSSFVVRSSEPLSGSGLRLDLSPGGSRFRFGLSLRQDSGRQESDSPDLRGLGDVRRTLRLRAAGSYPLDGWRAGASITADALGRGGGELAELALSRSIPLAPRLGASVSTTVSYGSARYMQAWYGINEEQAARSGYPVYRPGAGMRDLALALGLRHELEGPWVVFGGASASRLLDKAAASPLTRQRDSWALSAGVAFRF